MDVSTVILDVYEKVLSGEVSKQINESATHKVSAYKVGSNTIRIDVLKKGEGKK